MDKQDTPRYGWGLLMVIAATVCWATSGIFITLVADGAGLSAIGLAFWRDIGTFSALFLGLLLARPAMLRVRRPDLPWLAAMGAISIGIFHVMWNTSVLLAGVSIATVLQSNAPILVTLMAWLLWREPLTGRKIGAIVLAFAGTLLISRIDGLGNLQVSPLGFLAGLGAAITYSTLSLFGKKLRGDYSAWTMLTYAFGFGALVLLPFQIGATLPWPLPWDVLAAYAALIFLPTIGGFALYTSSLKYLPASVASIAATMEIPFAAVVGYIFLLERLDGWQILGAVLVVGGVVLLSWPRQRGRPVRLWRRIYKI